MTDARPLPWFSECVASRHHWLRRGRVAKIVWNDDHTEGRLDAAHSLDTAKVGAVCSACGILERSFCPYPRRLAPMVAP